ncbi:hypothetical protein Q9L42_000310 (plasmid) [Methylomarinum sp. Ch1-1]|uniref:Glycosyltransferase n=1 Tax=Methylomarinum roseum TaxID=3067653 RepID=A0AAU7NP80_9GAMM|nr:hypothetical protein [Methylomarinum sp. Ch1-1]MDP4523083.1 hypothetical protein [Methylomarinum sp. Ch1-1]
MGRYALCEPDVIVTGIVRRDNLINLGRLFSKSIDIENDPQTLYISLGGSASQRQLEILDRLKPPGVELLVQNTTVQKEISQRFPDAKIVAPGAMGETVGIHSITQ